MHEDEQEEDRLHRDRKFTGDLADLVRRERSQAQRVGECLSHAVDCLLADPRPSKLPIYPFDESQGVWEYVFHPRYSFIYWAEDRHDESGRRVVRHYHLLRILRKLD